MLKEEVNYVRLFMRDVDKKASEKIKELEDHFNVLNDHTIRNKVKMEEDVNIKLAQMDKQLNLQEETQEKNQNILRTL